MHKIKFLKISPIPANYRRELYRHSIGLENKSYSEQYRVIMEDCFGWADFWKINLEKTGKYDVVEIITDVECLQKKWAEENNITYSKDSWKKDILIAQVAFYKPEVLFAHDLIYLAEIKSANPYIKLVFSWDGIMSRSIERFKGCDIVLSCDKEMSDYYTQTGLKGYFFPFGFETTILKKIKQNRNLYNVSFIGSVQMQSGYHKERFNFLSYISKIFKIDLWVSSIPSFKMSFDKFWIKQFFYAKPSHYFNLIRLSLRNHGNAYGVDMYQKIADSKISLNIHPDNKSATMRLFEATGAGTCLVTDHLDNIKDFFELDKEIVTYKSYPEAVEKIKYLLNHDDERKKIALAAQERVINEYSFEARVKKFSEYLEKEYNNTI